MNNKSITKDYLKNEISVKKTLLKDLNEEVLQLTKSIKMIENSKTYLFLNFLKSNKIKLAFLSSYKKIKFKALTLFEKVKNKFLSRKYIVRLKDIKVSRNYKISIVIPTYYAEDFMPALLKAISAQKYIEDLDLIIIDSESKDRTQELAKEFGANVLVIKQKDFTHSLARNIAAREARHDLILFTVQDELPADNTTFAKMAELLSLDKNIATVSTNQIARPDADLFARWQVDNHNEALDLTYDSISHVENFKKFSLLPFFSQRRIALLDDVCALYRKDVFDKLGGFTEIVFGEDLDYAFKTLKSGYKLGLLCSSGVIHSHNRPAHYFLKRTFISSMLDLKLFSAVDAKKIFNPILDLVAGLTISEYLSRNNNLHEFSTADLENFMKDFILNNLRENDSMNEVSKLLFSILQEIKLTKKSISDKDILDYYQVLLDILNSYLGQHPHIIVTDKDKFIFLERMLSTKVGDALARYCLGKQTNKVRENTKLLKSKLYGNV